MALLFSPLQLRGIEFPNRIFFSPVCQFCSYDGHPTDWHLVHLGSRAIGAAGLVMVETSAVSPEGRVTPNDMGIWTDDHVGSLGRIAQFLKKNGTIAGIEISHAGQTHSLPLSAIIERFASATGRALRAGFQVLELDMSHGFLLQQFLSPITNPRTDEYGGSFENRCRLPLEVTRAVRQAWPDHLPLFIRLSVRDWKEGAWDLDQSVKLARELKSLGADLIVCSSGGIAQDLPTPVEPGFQIPFSARIRKEAQIATAAVGRIETQDANRAEEILRSQKADAISLGKALIQNPYWPRQAASLLGVELPWPKQYERLNLPRLECSISIADFRELFFKEEPLMVIDVRSAPEFYDGHIIGSIHVPQDEILNYVSNMSKDHQIVTVSNEGTGRARQAASLLRSHGWIHARWLEGGYLGWSGSGMPNSEPGLISA